MTDAESRLARGNYVVLMVVSILIGLGVAVYEVALPLYFNRIHLSWMDMGWIYGASALLTFVLRVGLGAWSDRVGRKLVYVLTLFTAGISAWLTPAVRSFLGQGALRSVAEPSMRVREAMHATLLYESSPPRFRRTFSRTRGVEFLFHFLGLLAAAWLVAAIAKTGGSPEGALFRGASATLVLAGLVFAFRYHEPPTHAPDRPGLRWRDLFHASLPRPLWVMAASEFVFMFSVFISHCFALQLFFKEKYGASDATVFVIGALHRLACALPLLFVGQVFHRRLRFWIMTFLVLEGVFLALPGFLPGGSSYSVAGLSLPAVWVAVGIWLIHDFCGMGLWLPMKQELMQRYSRPETRGKDISLVQSIGALGVVAAPFAAGALRQWPGVAPQVAVNFPFIFSGLGVACSAVILLLLPSGSRPDGSEEPPL